MKLFRFLRRRAPVAFMSSTSVDLGEWRVKVGEILATRGVQPLDMKEFPAMARAAADGSRQMVKRSDVFIGIYARRYGSLHHDGRAIIEHEYDEATEAGMPKLCFILDESAPWPAELTESEPASLRLKAFLQRVQTEKGIPDV
jgi:Domain of unknown function (DUF4062)